MVFGYEKRVILFDGLSVCIDVCLRFRRDNWGYALWGLSWMYATNGYGKIMCFLMVVLTVLFVIAFNGCLLYFCSYSYECVGF